MVWLTKSRARNHSSVCYTGSLNACHFKRRIPGKTRSNKAQISSASINCRALARFGNHKKVHVAI